MVIETFFAGKPQGLFSFNLIKADLAPGFKSGEYKVTLEKCRTRRKR